MFSSLLVSMKCLGLYPDPISSTTTITSSNSSSNPSPYYASVLPSVSPSLQHLSPLSDNSNRGRAGAFISRNISISLLGIFYSTILVILAWFNAVRFFTLFFAMKSSFHFSDITYYTLLCLYYTMGASLRTVIYIGCLKGRWQLLVRTIELMNLKHTRKQPQIVKNSKNFYQGGNKQKNNNKATLPGPLFDVNKTRNKLRFVTFCCWLFLLTGEVIIFLIVYLNKAQFGVFATPLHLSSSKLKDYHWPLAAILTMFLNVITDGGAVFGNVFICCLTLIHADNYRQLLKFLKSKSLSPSADIELVAMLVERDHLEQEAAANKVDSNSSMLILEEHENKENDAYELQCCRSNPQSSLIPLSELLSINKKLSSPPSVTASSLSTSSGGGASGFFDAETCRDLHLRLVTVARQLDRLARFAVFTAMTFGFVGILILLYQITLCRNCDIIAKTTWFFWLIYCGFLLFAILLVSADLASASETLLSSIYELLPRRVTCLKPSATQLTVLLSQLATEQVSLTFLGLIRLRKQSIIALLATLLTYFLIILVYTSNERHPTSQQQRTHAE